MALVTLVTRARNPRMHWGWTEGGGEEKEGGGESEMEEGGRLIWKGEQNGGEGKLDRENGKEKRTYVTVL